MLELEVVVADDGGAVFAQTWFPMEDISIPSPQFEHFMVGRKLAGRMPLAASVAASDIV